MALRKMMLIETPGGLSGNPRNGTVFSLAATWLISPSVASENSLAAPRLLLPPYYPIARLHGLHGLYVVVRRTPLLWLLRRALGGWCCVCLLKRVASVCVCSRRIVAGLCTGSCGPTITESTTRAGSCWPRR